MKNPLFKALIQGTNAEIIGYPYSVYGNGIDSIQYHKTRKIEYIRTDTLCQFTGIYANDKPVFSDDLLKYENIIFRIYQVAGGFCIKAENWMQYINDLDETDYLILKPLSDLRYRQFVERCEIVGNYHLNK